MSDEVTVDTLERPVDAFNAHDLDAVMSFFSSDCVLEIPRGPDPWGHRFEGWEDVREGLGSRFTGIPGCPPRQRPPLRRRRPRLLRVAADRHDDGRGEDRVQGCDLFEHRNGKITRKDSYWKIVSE
jgi:ketosteroid isomerase-like protein